jgi:hypothetical protein
VKRRVKLHGDAALAGGGKGHRGGAPRGRSDALLLQCCRHETGGADQRGREQSGDTTERPIDLAAWGREAAGEGGKGRARIPCCRRTGTSHPGLEALFPSY